MATRGRGVQQDAAHKLAGGVFQRRATSGSKAGDVMRPDGGLDADWDASWNAAWDMSWAAARDAARESSRLAARAAAAEATRKAALRAARMAWRNPADELRRQLLRGAAVTVLAQARRYILILAALAPSALRYALVVIQWLVGKARKLGGLLFSLAPLVGSIMRILGVWLARSLRKVAAWGNKEVVDARPRTRIL